MARPGPGSCVELSKRVRPSNRRSGPFLLGPVFRHRFAAQHYRASCSTQPASAEIAVRIAIKISALLGPRPGSRSGSSGFRRSAMSHFQSGRANPRLEGSSALRSEAQDGPEVDGRSISVGADTPRLDPRCPTDTWDVSVGISRTSDDTSAQTLTEGAYKASLFGLATLPDLCTGGKTLQGKLIHSSVRFQTYSHFTSDWVFS